jgi:splicing factor U2AF subunit
MRPAFSQTLLLPHLYAPPPPPVNAKLDQNGQPILPDDSEHFYDFYEDVGLLFLFPRSVHSVFYDSCLCFLKVIDELSKYGEVEEVNVVANLGDHMFGNVYIKYHSEEEAEVALQGLRGRYYFGM